MLRLNSNVDVRKSSLISSSKNNLLDIVFVGDRSKSRCISRFKITKISKNEKIKKGS